MLGVEDVTSITAGIKHLVSWYCDGEGNGKPLHYPCQENLDILILSLKKRRNVIVLEDGTPRSEGTLRATGEEQGSSLRRLGCNDAPASNHTIGSASADANVTKEEGRRFSWLTEHRIGTWNVRTMNHGKLEIVKAEMVRTGLSVLGISELKWTGKGHFNSESCKVYFSGNDTLRRRGVAIIVNQTSAASVLGYNPISDRMMSIRIQAKPVNLTIFQVYAPTADASDEDIADFYGELKDNLDKTPKKDALFIMGDLNAKVGKEQEAGVTGAFGLGCRNEAGNHLVDFCRENKLVLTNTLFCQHNRRLYTWTSPDGISRNQIDYIMCQQRWRSAVKSAKTLPGADCGSDHELLTATIKFKLKKTKKIDKPTVYAVDHIPASFETEIKNRFEPLLSIEIEESGSNRMWENMKEVIKQAADKHIPRRSRSRKSPWLTQTSIDIANARRAAKCQGDKERVRKLNADFQRQARRDKEAFLNDQCRELQSQSQNPRKLYKTVRDITGQFKPRLCVLKNKQGEILTEENDIKERWKEYTHELYQKNDNIKVTFQETDFAQEPEPTSDEVLSAINSIADNKSPGIDNIPIEFVKKSGDIGHRAITRLCQAIWRTCHWPTDWKRSVYVPLPKKGDTRECPNNRTITLIAHTSKVLLKIILNRLETCIKREIPAEQAAHRKGRGTRDHIANIRWIMEKAREMRQDLFMCFIDYSKAFDCVDHPSLWNCLRTMGVPEHIIVLIKNLYTGQEATVRTDYGNTDWFNIGKGVRQGCILSPALFNFYSENVMRNAGLEELKGISVGGLPLNNLRYADDTTLIASSPEDLQKIILHVKRESEKAGLTLNIKKTKIMSTADIQDFKVGDEQLEVVKDFTFLGSLICKDGDCAREIRRRLGMGRTTMSKLESIMRNKDVKIKTKIRLIQTLVFPVVTYGCESWILRMSDRRRIESFELWVWRRMLRIPWTAKKTNKWVLAQVKTKQSLLNTIDANRLRYFGHVTRANRSLEKQIMQGKMEGSRGRGRPRTRWLDNIVQRTGMTLSVAIRLTENRLEWRRKVNEVTRGRQRLDGL